MDWQELSSKLKSLGMQLGKEQAIKPPSKADIPIEKAVEGFFQKNMHGEIFTVSRHYDPGFLHGKVALSKPDAFKVMSSWAKLPDIENSQFENILFLDTETTGLSGGTGTMAFMVGVGRFKNSGFLLHQYFLRHPAEELGMLTALSEFLQPLTAICTYNGKTFDIPLLNSRYILQSLISPFIDIPHYDLLTLTRRIWRDRLNSCTLSNIEEKILGVQREEIEVPGYLIPEMYTDYLRSGDARPMQGIFYHNAIDVLSLAALFIHSAELLSNPINAKSNNGTDLASIARLFQTLGHEEQATVIFEESIQHQLPDNIRIKTLLRYASIYKRKKEYAKAILLWKMAAEIGSIFACEELAKYYEHIIRDYSQAKEWTQKAISACDSEPTWKDSLMHRLQRLEVKEIKQ